MLHLHEEAEREFIQGAELIAQDNYSAAEEFIDEIEKALREITLFPNRYVGYATYYRERVIKKFHYSIFYRIHGEDVYVLANYHHSRKPNRWMKRDNTWQ
ncbi:MAG TPA: type II toxin-antitoxin system RelE/ParE family toxin [Candidatus Kapabacteria bacterium]|jgi:plasmid stabilization system protein ParE|nr:type II toxin-antitoxin system RelE/ParE family toxin [Candidatus Kapabacteria bacterium]